MAFKDLDDSDYVVGQVWGRLQVDAFLVAQKREQMGLTASCKAVLQMSREFPDASAKYIEDKANGPAVIDVMHDKIPGLIAVPPEGGKTARAIAVQPFVESGNVYIPHPHIFPWVEDFIDELAKFPNGNNDDQVDACSQGLYKLLKGVVEESEEEHEDDQFDTIMGDMRSEDF